MSKRNANDFDEEFIDIKNLNMHEMTEWGHERATGSQINT